MDRRQFLKIAAVIPAVAVVPIALATQEPLRWRHVQQYTLNADELPIRPEFDTQLRIGDMRELTQYYINTDRFGLRHDICFTLNGRGKRKQYNLTQYLDAGDTIELLNTKREIALQHMQFVFDLRKRIRANLVPLQVPLGMHVPSAEEIIRGVR